MIRPMNVSSGRAGDPPAARALGDFTADRRLLILLALALVAGVGGVLGAWFLLKLIAVVSNLVWRGRLATQPVDFTHLHPSLWMVLAPALGGLVVGLMARFGS